ncbi:MAG: hypothetical protein MHMPM18_002885, partial [Marteilia pararefringens]
LASITSSLNLESICEAQNKDLKFDNKKCVCITSLDAICYSNAIKQILLESELLKHLPILISHQLRIAGKHFLPTCGLVICDFKKIQLSSKLMPKTVLMSTDCSSSSDESNLSGDSETNQILENSLKIPKFDSDESKSEVVDEEVTLSSTSLENLLSSNFVAEKLKSLKLDNSSNNYKILEDYQRTIESQSDHLDIRDNAECITTATILGGIIAKEIINFVEFKHLPLNNVLLYDSEVSDSQCLCI